MYDGRYESEMRARSLEGPLCLSAVCHLTAVPTCERTNCVFINTEINKPLLLQEVSGATCVMCLHTSLCGARIYLWQRPPRGDIDRKH